jgi:hypothetical protein
MQDKEHPMDAISLDAAVAITGMSKSTLWRRVTEGFIGKAEKDARNRAMLVLADVLPLARCFRWRATRGRRCTGWTKRPRKAMPMRCTGWRSFTRSGQRPGATATR